MTFICYSGDNEHEGLVQDHRAAQWFCQESDYELLRL